MSTYYIIEPPVEPTPVEPAPVYNYTTYLASISTSLSGINTSLNTIETNSTTIADKLTVVADKHTIIASKLTEIETYQKKLKELGEGPGIHIIGPYDWIGIVALYKLFIEEGDILDVTDDVSTDQAAAALSKFNDYIDKIRALPTLF